MMPEKIMTVPLEFTSTGKPKFTTQFAEAVGRQSEDPGFLAFPTPGIEDLLPASYRYLQEFFELPYRTKRPYAFPGIHFQRGWTPPYTEDPVACRSLEIRKRKDSKECFFMGITPKDLSLLERFPTIYAKNVWPEEVPGLKWAMWRIFNFYMPYVKVFLQAQSVYFGKDRYYFSRKMFDGPTVMRGIRYPHITPAKLGQIIWACMHGDINWMTLLPPSMYVRRYTTDLKFAPEVYLPESSGLYVRTRGGEWIKAVAPPGYTIMQVCDMSDYWSGGKLLSTAHEVRAPQELTEYDRLMFALFVHLRSDVKIAPVVSDEKLAALYPPTTAGTLLNTRLKEINLGKVGTLY